MNKLKCNYIMWDFKDCKSYSDCIELKNKLNKTINKYDNIYTHSLSGETCHPQHILIYKYFFEYNQKNIFVSNLNIFKSKMSSKKYELLKMYRSQIFSSIIFHLTLSSQEDYLQIK